MSWCKFSTQIKLVQVFYTNQRLLFTFNTHFKNAVSCNPVEFSLPSCYVLVLLFFLAGLSFQKCFWSLFIIVINNFMYNFFSTLGEHSRHSSSFYAVRQPRLAKFCPSATPTPVSSSPFPSPSPFRHPGSCFTESRKVRVYLRMVNPLRHLKALSCSQRRIWPNRPDSQTLSPAALTKT